MSAGGVDDIVARRRLFDQALCDLIDPLADKRGQRVGVGRRGLGRTETLAEDIDAGQAGELDESLLSRDHTPMIHEPANRRDEAALEEPRANGAPGGKDAALEEPRANGAPGGKDAALEELRANGAPGGKDAAPREKNGLDASSLRGA